MNKALIKKSRSNDVFIYLKDQILKNNLLPGDKIIETDISNRLGVSRTPVREALVKLNEEGLVDSYPRRSYIVSKISIKEARDLYFIRETLEPRAVEIVAKRGLCEKTVCLQETIGEMDECLDTNNLERLQELTLQWNWQLIDVLGNDIMKEVMKSINERSYRFATFIFRDTDNLIYVYDCIKAIHNCIEVQDYKRAKSLSYSYVKSLYPLLESQCDYKMFKE